MVARYKDWTIGAIIEHAIFATLPTLCVVAAWCDIGQAQHCQDWIHPFNSPSMSLLTVQVLIRERHDSPKIQ